MLANPSIVYKLKTSVQNISLKVYYSHILLNVHYTITCQVGECLFDRVYIKYIRYFVLRFLLDLSQRPFREWSSRTSRHDMYISQAGTLCTCTIEGGGMPPPTFLQQILFLTLHVLDPPTFTFVIACNNETEYKEF